MPIINLVILQCSGVCERYLADEPRILYGGHETAFVSRAAKFLDQRSAIEEALRSGWTTNPLRCPDCQPQQVVKRGETREA